MEVRHARPVKRTLIGKSGRGFLEVYSSPLGEVPVLHVAGSPEEMGYQYGALAGDKISVVQGFGFICCRFAVPVYFLLPL